MLPFLKCRLVNAVLLQCKSFTGRCEEGKHKKKKKIREHEPSGVIYHSYLSIYLTMSVLPGLQPLGPKSMEMF